MITRIDHVQITIPRGAEDQARRFYCELLGLREIEKPEELRGRGGFWLELADVQVHVGVEDGADRAGSKAHIAYEVRDLEGWRKKLQSIDVRIIDSIRIPGWSRFEFRDPFGNRVEFLERTE